MKAVAIALSALFLQSYPPPVPRDGARRLLESDRVIVWELQWPKGKSTALHRHDLEHVSIGIEQGPVLVTNLDGSSFVGEGQKLGGIIYGRKGTVHVEEGQSERSRRAVWVQLKDGVTTQTRPHAAKENPLPPSGATKAFENDRVVAWDYTVSTETVRHHHTADYVEVSISEGRVRRVGAGGVDETVEYHLGTARLGRAGDVHTEQAVSGRPRVIVVELK